MGKMDWSVLIATGTCNYYGSQAMKDSTLDLMSEVPSKYKPAVGGR